MNNSNTESIESVFATLLDVLFAIQNMIKICEILTIGLEARSESFGIAIIKSQKIILLSLASQLKDIIIKLEPLLDPIE